MAERGPVEVYSAWSLSLDVERVEEEDGEEEGVREGVIGAPLCFTGRGE